MGLRIFERFEASCIDSAPPVGWSYSEFEIVRGSWSLVDYKLDRYEEWEQPDHSLCSKP